MRVCDLEHRWRHCAALTGYNLDSNLTWRVVVHISFTFEFQLFFVCGFFFNVGLTKKSLAADKSKITHSNRRLPNIVRIDKYTANTFLKKKGKNGKKPCCIYAVVSLHCPLRRHVPFFFSLYWLPVQSNATQRKLTIGLMLRLVSKKKRLTVWTKLHDPVCVLVLGVTHASMTSAKL